MIDIWAEIIEDNRDFISIHDLIEKIESQSKDSLRVICMWVMKEITKHHSDDCPVNVYSIDDFYRVTMYFNSIGDDLPFIENKLRLLIQREELPLHPDEPFIGDGSGWYDSSFYNFGFSIRELKLIFRDINLDKIQPRPSGWGTVDLTSSNINASVDIDTPVERAPDIEWEKKFAGRTAALEIIGAISKVLVEKSGSKYLHGENISANAIADSVADMTDKSPGNYRKLISEALKISGLAKD